MTLLDLTTGDKAIIVKVRGRGAFRRRITEMGFVVGKEVQLLRKAPLQDPIEYNVMGYNVSLRSSESALIEVIRPAESGSLPLGSYSGTFTEMREGQPNVNPGKIINVAMVGNPNSGKTTIFNHASGSTEKVANYSGVTIDSKEARFSLDGYEFIITDLPGTYSLTAYTPEESYVRRHINENMPDIVVNVLDASNLERNLYLTTQLIDMDIQVVAALNMYDELQKSNAKLDYNHLGDMLGIPFIPVVAYRGRGIINLFRKIIEVFEGRDKQSRHIHINYGVTLERAIKQIQEKLRIPDNQAALVSTSSRFIAIKLLENDPDSHGWIRQLSNYKELETIVTSQQQFLEKELREDTETLITDAKYGFIAGALAETLVPDPIKRRRKTESIDELITHKVWGIPIFLLMMWAIFYGTFKIGQYPVDWIAAGIQYVSDRIQHGMNEGILKDFLVQGIIGGVGGVLTFLPNIMLLYLFISLMEDTGYMARAVFIMDKFMHKIGLHGKSFIPMLMGFGCNVPAILSTRVIESRRDRMITMFITPFMSCSARLPVYILFISAFFTRYQGTILFGLYFSGIAIAILSSLLLKKTFFKKKDVPFVMELPPYRVPTARSILKHMWSRAGQYLRKIGGVILTASVIIWALGYFPSHYPGKETHKNQLEQLNKKIEEIERKSAEASPELMAVSSALASSCDSLQLILSGEQQRNSYIGRIGKLIEPFMQPLGFDWKLSVAILTGISAKEVVVGTLGVLYQADSNDTDASLIHKLRSQVYSYGPKMGNPVITPLTALSFMFFILIYFPCIGVVSAISKESGSWKWAMFIVAYTTILAYLVSLSIFQLGTLLTS